MKNKNFYLKKFYYSYLIYRKKVKEFFLNPPYSSSREEKITDFL